MSEIREIKRDTLSFQVMETVKEYILGNNLKPGDRLPAERQLSAALGVSRTILREALRGLQTVGILEIRGGGGVFVAELDYPQLVHQLSFMALLHEGQLEHLVRLWSAMETGSLEYIAKNMTDEDFARLEDIARRMGTSSTLEEQIAADMEFHQELMAIAHNPLMDALSAFLTDFCLRVKSSVRPDRSADNMERHLMILDSIRKQDIESARTALYRHINSYLPGSTQ